MVQWIGFGLIPWFVKASVYHEDKYVSDMVGANVDEIVVACVGESDGASDGRILGEFEGLYVGENLVALFVGTLAGCDVAVFVGVIGDFVGCAAHDEVWLVIGSNGLGGRVIVYAGNVIGDGFNVINIFSLILVSFVINAFTDDDILFDKTLCFFEETCSEKNWSQNLYGCGTPN